MSIHTLIATYGYFAIAIGVAVEGKAVAFIAGIIAHHGDLSVPLVIIASIIGTFAANQILFYTGRWLVNKRKKHPETSSKRRYKDRIEKIQKLFNHSPFMVILLFRFFPGFRIIAPIVIGMTKFARVKFLIYDITGVVITSAFLVYLGHSFGKLIEKTIAGTKDYDLWIALAIAICAIAATLIRKYKRKKKLKEMEESETKAEPGINIK
jgi:membrane protein DedA with SNARE-associated domain